MSRKYGGPSRVSNFHHAKSHTVSHKGTCISMLYDLWKHVVTFVTIDVDDDAPGIYVSTVESQFGPVHDGV